MPPKKKGNKKAAKPRKANKPASPKKKAAKPAKNKPVPKKAAKKKAPVKKTVTKQVTPPVPPIIPVAPAPGEPSVPTDRGMTRGRRPGTPCICVERPNGWFCMKRLRDGSLTECRGPFNTQEDCESRMCL